MKFLRLALTATVFSCALAACGGGGGSTPAPPPPTPVQTATPTPSVSGDMLALSPNRGWNYQATSASSGSITISVYVDPSKVNGQFVVAGAAVSGLVATVLTDHNTAESNVFGGLAFTQNSAGYNVTAEVSAGSKAQVPGAPLFVGSTLTQGAVSTPYPGVTETVLAVGTAPNVNACPTPLQGAQVSYSFQGQTYTLWFVPGCGITQVIGPSGLPFNLVSVGTYNIGDLSRVRSVASLSIVDTARSVMGLERNDFPAARLFK